MSYLMNDWEIKKCLRICLVIPLATLGLIGLAALGFDIPGLRQIVGFVFLTLIPGILILRIIKIHNVGVIESLVYSVGLSLAFVMFSGVFANFVLPLVGVSRPISALPITTTLVVFTLILGAIAYRRDKDFSAPTTNFHLGEILSPPYLLLLTLPLLAVLGAHLVNLYQNNFLLLFFIIVVCCVVALVAFNRLPKNSYPLAIVMIGVSLLLHVSLISSQLWGYDIHVEHYYQNLVAQNGYWDFTIPGNGNTALSITMLCPIYSIVLNMDAIWVFKTIYPILFCLVPLALFHISSKQIGSKRAFFAAFFFIGMPMFFILMPQLARQQIAELFFALLILLMVDRKLALSQRLSLFIIFSLSLIVSHYALGYICLAFLVGSWIIVALIKSKARLIWDWLTRRFGGLPRGIASDRAFPAKTMAVIMGIYLMFMLGWYGGIAQGTVLNTIRQIGRSQYTLLSTELSQLPSRIVEPTPTGPTPTGPTPTSRFVEPTEREALIGTALGLDFFSVSALGKGFRVFQYITQLFIVIGSIWLILKPRGFKAEYIGLTAVAAVILLACIVIPRFSSYLNVTRFYHICLFTLAPFCILGGEVIWKGVIRLFKFVSSQLKIKRGQALSTNPDKRSAYPRFLALAILIPYFIFTTGFVFEVGGCKQYCSVPKSMALSHYRLDTAVFNQKEADAVAFLVGKIDDNTPVFGDEHGRLLLYDQLYGQVGIISASGEVPENALVFLRTRNIQRQEIAVTVFVGPSGKVEYVTLNHMPSLLKNRHVIYNNGGAQILAPK